MKTIIKFALLLAVLSYYTYITLPLFTYAPQLIKIGRLHRIERFKPHFSYILNLSQQTEALNQYQIRRYIQYYEYIKKQNEQDVTTLEILAFCYFHQGQTEKARLLYLEASKTTPPSFEAFYNLGHIYLLKKDFGQAKIYFQKALGVSAEDTLKRLLSSSSTLQIILANELSFENLGQFIKINYQRAAQYVEILSAIESHPNVAAKKENITKDLIKNSQLILF